jgi:phosphotransferase system enzyme I (PtsI)
MVEASEGKQITIRTLDLGGDKLLEGWNQQKEANPFMGFRAIRYCLSNPRFFWINFRRFFGQVPWGCSYYASNDFRGW